MIFFSAFVSASTASPNQCRFLLAMAFIPNLPNPRQALRFARQSKSTHGDHHAALGLTLRGDRQRKDQGRLLRLRIGYSLVSDHVRRASANNTIKERLKNPDDEFELVIVKGIAFSLLERR